MSVASKNLYELLGNDPDSEGEVKAPPKEVVKQKPTTKKRDEAPQPVAAPAQQERGGNRGRGGRGGRRYEGNEGAYRDRGAGRENNRARDTDEQGAPRGGRGGRGRGGRREFDRHSATGIVDTEKKVSQGWGSNKGDSEWKEEKAGESMAQAEAAPSWDDSNAPAPEAAAAAEGAAAEETPAAPAEPEEKVKTYEDYLAEKRARQAALGALPEARQPNEGSRLDKKWAAATPLARKDEEENAYFAPTTEKTQKVKERKTKQTLEIDQRFQDTRENRRGGERGGRGRGEGGRGRGAPRGERRGGEFRGGRNGPRGGNPTVDLADTSAFPSLGA